MRWLAFALVWGLITRWEPASWIVGIPVVAAAAWLSLVLRPREAARLRPTGLLGLFPFFLWQSLRAGLDAAGRAIRGASAIDPLVCRVPAGLPDIGARVLTATVTTLLPGALAVDLDGNDYVIHALAGPEDAVMRDVRRVEARVAPVFGLPRPEADTR